MPDEEETKKLTLHLPQSLKEEAQALAKLADQSLNKYIVSALRARVDTDKKKRSEA